MIVPYLRYRALSWHAACFLRASAMENHSDGLAVGVEPHLAELCHAGIGWD